MAPIRDLDQSLDRSLRFSQEPPSLNDQTGGAQQLDAERLGVGGTVEGELVGRASSDALRDEFFRLLNKRGLAARHE